MEEFALEIGCSLFMRELPRESIQVQGPIYGSLFSYVEHHWALQLEVDLALRLIREHVSLEWLPPQALVEWNYRRPTE